MQQPTIDREEFLQELYRLVDFLEKMPEKDKADPGYCHYEFEQYRKKWGDLALLFLIRKLNLFPKLAEMI
jgi:hypothetical protein